MILRPGFLAGLAAAAVAGAVAGFFTWQYVLAPQPSVADIADPLTDPKFLALVPDKAPAPDESLLGQPAPPLELVDLAGEPLGPARLAGKVIVVNFWATWCGPCREEMPMLADLQRRYAARGVVVVGLAMDDAEAVRAFATEYGIDYPLAADDVKVMALNRRFGNRLGAIPYTAVVDREGLIRFMKAGRLTADDLDPVVESHL